MSALYFTSAGLQAVIPDKVTRVIRL